MVLTLGGPIVSADAQAGSGNPGGLEAGLLQRTCADIQQDARQTVVADAFPVARSAGGETQGLAGVICDQGMGLVPATSTGKRRLRRLDARPAGCLRMCAAAGRPPARPDCRSRPGHRRIRLALERQDHLNAIRLVGLACPLEIVNDATLGFWPGLRRVGRFPGGRHRLQRAWLEPGSQRQGARLAEAATGPGICRGYDIVARAMQAVAFDG